MRQIDNTFYSCQGLQKLFRPLSPDLVALQMSRGPLQGRLRVFHLGAVRFNLLETNQSLFLSGTRRPKPCTVAIPLEEPKASSPYRAQGIPVESTLNCSVNSATRPCSHNSAQKGQNSSVIEPQIK